MSSLPGMQDRTLSVYSAGKLFACTGARVGWVIGPAHLIKSLSSVHQYSVFCMYDPIQSAVAESLETARQTNYMKDYADKLIQNRNVLVSQLLQSQFDLKLWIPKSGFFVMTDISSVQVK